MQRVNALFSVFVTVAFLCATSIDTYAETAVISDAQVKTANELMQTALESNLGFEIVESLTTEIGPRLGGSEAEARARAWGAKLGKELGFDRVSVEEFTMPFWVRGDLHISMESPYQQELYGTALGGAAPSERSIESSVVYFRDIEALKSVGVGELENKIAFVDGDIMVKSQTGAGYGQANQRRSTGWQHAERGGGEIGAGEIGAGDNLITYFFPPVCRYPTKTAPLVKKLSPAPNLPTPLYSGHPVLEQQVLSYRYEAAGFHC